MSTAYYKSQHDMALPVPASGSARAPEWVHLMPTGRFSGRDGRGPYVLGDPAAVIAATHAFFGGADMPLDYDHQTERTAVNGKPAPAAGWFRKMEVRPDGIWAQVEWTERGARGVASREYRYISPAFFHDVEGRILRFSSAALTNFPNLELKALSSAKHCEESSAYTGAWENDMNFQASIAQALGLPVDAGEDEIIAAARAASQAGKALNASTPDPSRFVPMEIYESIGRELTALKASNAKSRTTGLLEMAQQEGKVTPAMMSWAESFAEASPEYFEKWAMSAPDLRPGGGKDYSYTSVAPRNQGTFLTEGQKAICAAMGHDEAAYQKSLGNFQTD